MPKNYVDFIKDAMTKPKLAQEYLTLQTKEDFEKFFKNKYPGVTAEDCKTLEEASNAYQGGISVDVELWARGGGGY